MPMDHDETYLENAEKKKALLKKIKAIDDQIKLETEEDTVNTPLKLISAVSFWKGRKETTEKNFQASLVSRELQIEQMREKIKRTEDALRVIQSQLESSRSTYESANAHNCSGLEAAQKRLDAVQAKKNPKVKKLQMQKETLQLEIEAMTAQEIYTVKMEDLNRKKETVAKRMIAPPSPSDSDNDSDDTWTTEMGEARIAEIRKMEAKGLYQNKKTMVWEKYREEDDEEEFDRTHFAHHASPPPSPKRESLNKVIHPGYDSEESYDEEKHGDYKEFMKKKFGI